MLAVRRAIDQGRNLSSALAADIGPKYNAVRIGMLTSVLCSGLLAGRGACCEYNIGVLSNVRITAKYVER